MKLSQECLLLQSLRWFEFQLLEIRKQYVCGLKLTSALTLGQNLILEIPSIGQCQAWSWCLSGGLCHAPVDVLEHLFQDLFPLEVRSEVQGTVQMIGGTF